jgi:putative transcriptional regulator
MRYHSEAASRFRRGSDMRAPLASVILLLATIPSPRGGPARETQTLKTQGQFLLASRDLPDPTFQQSVVLMLPIREEGLLVGLIVNKPTKFSLHDVFPRSAALQKSDTKAYFGGPVDADVFARSALFRSKTPPKDATLVFGDVYISFDPDAIAALAANSQQASTLRVFLGRAQWDAAQLENEAARGAWHSLPAAADSIFSAFPENVWPRLIDRAEPRPVVQMAPPSFPVAIVIPREDAFCTD